MTNVQGQINEINFDKLLVEYDKLPSALEFCAKNGIPANKVAALYYDLNEVQVAILPFDEIKYIFSERTELKNGVPKKSIDAFRFARLVDDIHHNIDRKFESGVLLECIDFYKKIQESSIAEKDPYNTSPWKNFLLYHRSLFYKAIASEDLHTLEYLFSNALRTQLTCGIFGDEENFKAYAASVGYHPYFHEFKIWVCSLNKNISKNDIEELGMSPVCNPYGVKIEDSIVNINSFFKHSQARFIKELLADIKKPVIMDIGSGLGLLCYYLQKMCNCTYICLDIPENLVVAVYYLKMSCPNKKVLLCSDIANLDDLSSYDIVLVPNHMLPHFPTNSIDLIINTVSFSGMSYPTIQEYFKQIDRVGRKYFYHENNVDSLIDCEFHHVKTFPVLKTFRKIYNVPSRWFCFNGVLDYIYSEFLFEKCK